MKKLLILILSMGMYSSYALERTISKLLDGRNLEITYTIEAIEDDVDDLTFLGLGFNDIEVNFGYSCKRYLPSESRNDTFRSNIITSTEIPAIKKGDSASESFVLALSEIEICENEFSRIGERTGFQLYFYANASDIDMAQILLTPELIQEVIKKGYAKRSIISEYLDHMYIIYNSKKNLKQTYTIRFTE